MLHKHLMRGSVVDRSPPQQLLLSLARPARDGRSEPCATCFCPQHPTKESLPHPAQGLRVGTSQMPGGGGGPPAARGSLPLACGREGDPQRMAIALALDAGDLALGESPAAVDFVADLTGAGQLLHARGTQL